MPVELTTLVNVALRKESVDRNYSFGLFGADTLSSLSARRAWIEMPAPGLYLHQRWALSARRAWIEMIMKKQERLLKRVALRKESVDRNDLYAKRKADEKESLSARRAWIEIPRFLPDPASRGSLSARRAWIEIPRHTQLPTSRLSLSARRAWIEIRTHGANHGFLASLSARRAWIEIEAGRSYIGANSSRSPQGERG